MSARELITEHIDLWTGAVTQRATRGRGSNGRIELTGIKKLRELILDLAVMGRLIEQDPEEQTTLELLARINEEENAQVKAKKIRKPKELTMVEVSEHPYSIPKNWHYCKLNDIGTWGAGATPKRGNSQYYNGQIPWFKSGELAADFITVSEETITELAVKETSVRMNEPGDVLIAMYGATIGKASILEVTGTTNQAVCACTPWSGISNRFLLLLLKAYRSRFIAMGAGGAQPNISREKIINTVIGLPPSAEQQRIVQKVDELMALCDRLEQQTSDQLEAHETLVDTLLGTLTQSETATELADNWAHLAAHFDTLLTTEQSIDKLKQTILQLAVMGRLVAQDSGDESATVFFQRLGIKSKPYFLRGWAKVALGDFGEIIGGSTPSKAKAEFWDGGIPWVSPKDMKVPIILNSQDRITEKALRESTLKTVPAQSILMVVRGMILAHSFPVAIAGRPLTINQDMKALVPPEEMSTYVLLYLQASQQSVVELVERSSHGTCKLISKTLWSQTIHIPPLQEQHRIVQKVDELMALCDQLKERLNQACETRCQLAQNIVKQAVS